MSGTTVSACIESPAKETPCKSWRGTCCFTVEAAANWQSCVGAIQIDITFALSAVCALVSATLVISSHPGACRAPCGLRGCKNRPAPFAVRMSYKANKPGLVLFYILAWFNCVVSH